MGIDRLLMIKSVSLKNNGICDDHEREILALLSITKIRNVDLSCNNINRLAGHIGRKLRDEITHLRWFDITQNDYVHDPKEQVMAARANADIISGLKKQKELAYAGVSTKGPQSDAMAHLIAPKRPAIALNMRNSTVAESAMIYISQALANQHYYITAISFKFCFLEFDDLLLLADGVKFNRSLVKLDLSNNCFKSCQVKFLFEALLDNCSIADLDFSGNFLDDEFAVDLAHLLESNATLHTVDISNNPIGAGGSKYLLQTILAHNDTLESFGNLKDTNMYMGVRIREEINQALLLNVNSHQRKRAVLNQIAATKANNPMDKDIPKLEDPLAKKKNKLEDDKTVTIEA